MNGFDWQAFIFDPEQAWMERLDRIAVRRFGTEERGGQAFNKAFAKLSENEWQILSGFAGRSLPGSYLVTVYKRLLEDFSRKEFGRRRPPRWLQRLGHTAVLIFRMLCLERQERETIVDHLCARGKREPEFVRSHIRMILAGIPDCGCRDFELQVADPSLMERTLRADSTPQRDLESADVGCLLAFIKGLIGDEDNPDGVVDRMTNPGTVLSRITAVREQLRLDDDQRLMLRAHYQDGRTYAAIGRAMDLPEQRVRRTCNRALKSVRAALKSAGIGEEVLSSV